MSKYRVLSLDRDTGAIKNRMEFTGRWGAMPYIFGTGNGKVAFTSAGLVRILNPDLSRTKISANVKGTVVDVSPDGSTLGLETTPGTTFLNTDTLQPISKLSESAPFSISRSAALSVQVSWDPSRRAESFILENLMGQRRTVLFHGKCGYPAQFLTDDRLLITGCAKIYILDTQGNIVTEKTSIGTGSFAGVSRNGKRFALEYSDERGDPSVLLYERFIIYDTATADPIASVLMDSLPERQSWSAFSPDGRYFAAGSPDKLSLYEIP